MCFAFGEGGKGGGGDNCVRWYETWIQSSGCVSTKTFVWNAIQKEKKRKEEQFLRLSIRNPRLFFLRGRHTKLVAFTFQSWLLLWCVDLSVHGPKNESLFSCSCNTVDPHSSRKQSTFSSFFLQALLLLLLLSQIPIPPVLPLLSSCPEWSGDMCFPAPAWRERKKSEVRSLTLPLSLPAEGSRQTGA